MSYIDIDFCVLVDRLDSKSPRNPYNNRTLCR